MDIRAPLRCGTRTPCATEVRGGKRRWSSRRNGTLAAIQSRVARSQSAFRTVPGGETTDLDNATAMIGLTAMRMTAGSAEFILRRMMTSAGRYPRADLVALLGLIDAGSSE